MFGYIAINKQEMKFKEFDIYQSYYCGLCSVLHEKYGMRGQITLSYDMTFIVMLLSSLYEPNTELGCRKCVAHPFEKHVTRRNEYSDYVADMNVLLSYYQCLDDWIDEKKVKKLLFAKLLSGANKGIGVKYQKKTDKVFTMLEKIHECERQNEKNVDMVAGYFGEIMAEIFTYKEDEWKEELAKMGFFLGKFIYLMDAYEDVEKDIKVGTYNPFESLYKEQGVSAYEQFCNQILTMMMAECSRAFERLPIIENVEILRNILYSGVWCRYEMTKARRKGLKDGGSL